MIEELIVDEANFCKTDEDYDALREAIQKLSLATEDQFKEIKEEKWYNRVFDMITFSKKGEKRLAEQVSSVAQAQQILIELLLRLSNNDAKISDLVLESMEDIMRLQEQDEYLLEKIKKFRDRELGKYPNYNIEQLSRENKEVLTACLYYLCDVINSTSENQREYAKNVLDYVGTNKNMDNVLNALEDTDEESRKIIFLSCMEYIYLENMCEDSWDEKKYEKLIDAFDLGNKTMKLLKKQILVYIKLCGERGLIDKYKVEKNEDIDDYFMADFEEEEVVNETNNIENYEIEKIEISSLLRIEKNEVKTFKGKEVYLHHYIVCEGTIEFEDCTIYYNTDDCTNQIILEEDASIAIKNSYVICRGKSNDYFILGKYKNNIQLIKNEFIDCSFFLNCEHAKKVIIEKSKMNSCFEGFITITMYYEKSFCDIISNKIIMGKLADYNISEEKYTYESLIYIKWGTKVNLIDNKFLSKVEFNNLNLQMYCIDYHGENCIVKNCEFEGVSYCIDGRGCDIVSCNFKKCREVISLYKEWDNVKDCIFENCARTIMLNDKSNIIGCTFKECDDFMIYGSFFVVGGIRIQYCTFINNLNCQYNSFIKLKRSYNGDCNIIKNCIFEGFKKNNCFLIEGEIDENICGRKVISVENSDFSKCEMQRNRIINYYSYYYGLFNKKNIVNVVDVRKCKGV